MKKLKLETLSTDQKLGLLLCARGLSSLGEENLEYTLNMIRNHALGCVHAPTNRPDILQKIREAADYPILIVTDMEMGFSASDLPPVPMMTLAACNNPEYYRLFARAVASEAKKAGFNGNWGPVIDILKENGPCRVYRTLSDDPEKVALAAEEITREFVKHHFLTCGKHYPCDYGSFDTHMANVGSYSTREEVENVNLYPYIHLMKKGLLPSIMSGHIVYHAIDPEHPASLSKKTIDVIRDMGFDGVCFTDSFGMMAILQKFGEENILGMAVAAGNDIILPNYRRTTKENFEMLKKNYEDGAFSEDRLNEAARRVLAAQALVYEEIPETDFFTEQDRESYYNIAKDCLTAVTDPGVDAALSTENPDKLFVILTDDAAQNAGPGQETVTRTWYHYDWIEEKIRQEFPQAEIIQLPEFPTAINNEKVLLAATRHTEVIFITFCNTRPYLGTDCLTRRTETLINSLIFSGKVSTVVHFGNPYALQPIHHVPRVIFGYMMPESQRYAIEVLSGKLPAKGKLPYHVELQ